MNKAVGEFNWVTWAARVRDGKRAVMIRCVGTAYRAKSPADEKEVLLCSPRLDRARPAVDGFPCDALQYDVSRASRGFRKVYVSAGQADVQFKFWYG